MPNSQIRRVVVCLLLSVFACSSYAQDIHFSQFSQSPLYVNPAYTGLFKGDWRFSNNYRNQWSAVGTPFKTISAGFDKPFKLYEGKLGLGIFVTNDQSGSYQLTANKIFVSASYHYKYRQHTFSGGIQAGYTIHSLNTETLIFPVQYNPNIGFYDEELPNFIDNWDENINYADINLGIAYSTRFQHINAVAALSAYHINSPSLSFLGEDARLAPRFAFNAYADIPLKNQWFVKPNIFTSFQKKPAIIWLVESLVMIFLWKNYLTKCIWALNSGLSFIPQMQLLQCWA